MDAELIAIQRVRRATKGLSFDGKTRVMQYVLQTLFEEHRSEALNSESIADALRARGPMPGPYRAGENAQAPNTVSKAAN